jgi:hypothetical protein
MNAGTSFVSASIANPRPNVAVTELALFIGGNVLLFRIAELPDFVTLNPLALQVSQSAVLIVRARAAEITQKIQDSVLRHSGHSLCRIDGVAFYQRRDYLGLPCAVQSVHNASILCLGGQAVKEIMRIGIIILAGP